MIVPVLSSTTAVDALRRFEHVAALDHDAELRAAAGADHDRGRRRQSERARAGDDQHRDRGGERVGRGSARRATRPASVTTAIASTIGTKTPEMRSARCCTGAFAALRRLDEARDLRERGVGTDPRRLDDEPARGVDGRAEHLVARRDVDRHRFAGEHRDVDRARALDDTPSVAIFSPGRTTKRSPTSRLAIGISSPFSSRAVLAPSASSARSACALAAARPRFEVAAEQDQRDDDRRGLEVDVAVGRRTSSATTDHVHAASVPIDTSVSIVTAPCRAFRAIATRWNIQPAHQTTGVANANAHHSHPRTAAPRPSRRRAAER